MKPIVTLGIGAGVLGVLYLFSKESEAAQLAAGPPTGSTEVDTDDWVVSPISDPAGFRRVKGSEVTPALSAKAKEILATTGSKAIGTQTPFTLDGKNYLGVIEQHYHPPGGPLKPWGPHHGVSLFVQSSDSGYVLTDAELGAVSKQYFRLHLLNEFVDPVEEWWTHWKTMTESGARSWAEHAAPAGGNVMAFVEKWVTDEAGQGSWEEI